MEDNGYRTYNGDGLTITDLLIHTSRRADAKETIV